jgi:hypothetical protein
MGTTSSRHTSGIPKLQGQKPRAGKPDKDCMKRKVFTAGFDVMGAEANIQVGFKSHTLKKYTAPPPINDNLRRIPGGPSGSIVPSVGTTGRDTDIATDDTTTTTGAAEAQR